jgi:hypothetical protein
LTIKLTPSQRRAINDLAERRGVSRGFLARQAFAGAPGQGGRLGLLIHPFRTAGAAEPTPERAKGPVEDAFDEPLPHPDLDDAVHLAYLDRLMAHAEHCGLIERASYPEGTRVVGDDGRAIVVGPGSLVVTLDQAGRAYLLAAERWACRRLFAARRSPLAPIRPVDASAPPSSAEASAPLTPAPRSELATWSPGGLGRRRDAQATGAGPRRSRTAVR